MHRFSHPTYWEAVLHTDEDDLDALLGLCFIKHGVAAYRLPFYSLSRSSRLFRNGLTVVAVGSVVVFCLAALATTLPPLAPLALAVAAGAKGLALKMAMGGLGALGVECVAGSVSSIARKHPVVDMKAPLRGIFFPDRKWDAHFAEPQ